MNIKNIVLMVISFLMMGCISYEIQASSNTNVFGDSVFLLEKNMGDQIEKLNCFYNKVHRWEVEQIQQYPNVYWFEQYFETIEHINALRNELVSDPKHTSTSIQFSQSEYGKRFFKKDGIFKNFFDFIATVNINEVVLRGNNNQCRRKLYNQAITKLCGTVDKPSELYLIYREITDPFPELFVVQKEEQIKAIAPTIATNIPEQKPMLQNDIRKRLGSLGTAVGNFLNNYKTHIGAAVLAGILGYSAGRYYYHWDKWRLISKYGLVVSPALVSLLGVVAAKKQIPSWTTIKYNTKVAWNYCVQNAW